MTGAFPHCACALDSAALFGWRSKSWSGSERVVWVASKFPAATTVMTGIGGETATEGRITRVMVRGSRGQRCWAGGDVGCSVCQSPSEQCSAPPNQALPLISQCPFNVDSLSSFPVVPQNPQSASIETGTQACR